MARKLSKNDLLAIVESQIHNAAGYTGGELSEQRREALEYYLGEPFGNEVDGRSQVISHDVRDVIEWMLPSLLKTFVTGDDAVQFAPENREDIDAAEQQTNYVNHIFFKDNNGFLIFYLWFKDALMQKNGIVKCFWEENEKVVEERYENLNDDELTLITSDENVKLKEHTQEVIIEEIEGIPVERTLHHIAIDRKTNKDNVRIINIPPENFGVNRDHDSLFLDDATFAYHKEQYTASQLIEMGYDAAIINKLPSAADELENEEETAREYIEDHHSSLNENTDETTRRITVYECYVKVDYDNNGIAELRKIVTAGHEILENEPADRMPFHVICPILVPHTFYGLSVADLIMELQEIKSTIWRQTLDNLYFQNNSRSAVDETRVNQQDLLTTRPGGVVRVQGDPTNAVAPIAVPNIGNLPYQMLEYCDKVREGRTGVSQSTMGLNDNLLNNNKGDKTVERLMTAAEQRVELIARIFAETGVKSLFLHIHELVLKHQQKERIIRIRNEWVPVNPSEWHERADMTVNVGLGTGERDKLSNALLQLTQLQNVIVQNGGMDVLVKPENIYNTVKDLMKFSGIRNIDDYLNDPTTPEAQQEIAQQKQAQASQGQMIQQLMQQQQQVEQQKNQIEAQKIKTESDIEIKKLKAQLAEKDDEVKLQSEKLALEREKMLTESQQKMEESLNDLAMRLTEIEAKTQTEQNKNYQQNQQATSSE